MHVAFDAWSVGFDEDRGGADVEGTPTPPSGSSVIPRVIDGRTVRNGCVHLRLVEPKR
jgi:hypothetical protein